jgi:hypothetical protein
MRFVSREHYDSGGTNNSGYTNSSVERING